jgi:hypothetical protein
MAWTRGRVEHLSLYSDNHCIVNIRIEVPTGINAPPMPPGPANELLVISVGTLSGILFLNELSRALGRGLRVVVFHEDDSAQILNVTVIAAIDGSVV